MKYLDFCPPYLTIHLWSVNSIGKFLQYSQKSHQRKPFSKGCKSTHIPTQPKAKTIRIEKKNPFPPEVICLSYLMGGHRILLCPWPSELIYFSCVYFKLKIRFGKQWHRCNKFSMFFFTIYAGTDSFETLEVSLEGWGMDWGIWEQNLLGRVPKGLADRSKTNETWH